MKTELNKNQTIIAFVILGLFTLLVAGASWYFLTTQSTGDYTNKRNFPEQKKTEDTEKTEETKETDETADWETYTDTKYGFSFKYPNGWKVEVDDPGSSAGLYTINLNSKLGDMTFEIGYGGRGYEGVATIINYDSKINGKKITLTNRQETNRDPKKYLDDIGGYPSGYVIIVGASLYNNDNYVIVFSGEDEEEATEADSYLNKIINTLTYK